MPGLSYQDYRTLLHQRSPQTGYDIKIDLIWNGAKGSSLLRSAIIFGVKRATKIYYNAIKSVLGRTWGSISIGGNRRLRLWHSKPGMPPHKQTENLVNSVNHNFNISGKGWNLKAVGEIYTNVPYAQTLEYGGVSARLARKVYTQWRLVNPINKIIRIAPRPAWRPTFRRVVSRMFRAIILP